MLSTMETNSLAGICRRMVESMWSQSSGRLFNARAGAGADVNLELAGVDGGKEVLAQRRGEKPYRTQRKDDKENQEDCRVIDAEREQAQIAAAHFLKAGLKGKLEPDQGIAAVRASWRLSASSCSLSRYLAMVGTTVRESR